jgi:hypothetical protein
LIARTAALGLTGVSSLALSGWGFAGLAVAGSQDGSAGQDGSAQAECRYAPAGQYLTTQCTSAVGGSGTSRPDARY